MGHGNAACLFCPHLRTRQRSSRPTWFPVKTPINDNREWCSRDSSQVCNYHGTCHRHGQHQRRNPQDTQLQQLSARILAGDWNKQKRDPDLATFYEAHNELFVVNDLIFRANRIVIPTSLQSKVIKAAHHLGHLRMTKTKQTLSKKYWFPLMNSMVQHIICQCYKCQVTTKQYRQKPVKDIPKKPRDIIAVDFGGPYPDGHNNLVAVDRRTRYLGAAKTHSTAAKPTMEKLNTWLAADGTPR